MLINANENIPHAPRSYESFLPALLTRPIALVHTVFSLNLAYKPMRDQSRGVQTRLSKTS